MPSDDAGLVGVPQDPWQVFSLCLIGTFVADSLNDISLTLVMNLLPVEARNIKLYHPFLDHIKTFCKLQNFWTQFQQRCSDFNLSRDPINQD